MPISKTRPRRPSNRVTPLDTSLSPRARDNSPSFGASHRPPPQAVLDLIAEATLHGGFKGKRHPTCPRCFTRKSANGQCCQISEDLDARVRRMTRPRERSLFADALGEL